MNPGAPEDTSTNDAKSCYVQRYLQRQLNSVQRQMNYAQRQLNYPQKLTQQFAKIHCPYIEQKVACEVHRQKTERCKNCLDWELEQFQKIKPLNTRKQ